MVDSNSQQTASSEQTDGGVVASSRERATSLLETRHLGTLGLVAGGALVVRALRAKTRGRRVVGVLAGLALVALGIRDRLAPRRSDHDDHHGEGSSGGSTATGTDTATRTAHAVEDVANPRDVSEDPDVETETDPDAGSVRFTTDHESGTRAESTLDEADAGQTDPRGDDGEESVTVDVSAPAMADEPNEATGPGPEQAQPTSTEATEPDPGPPTDESETQEDAGATTDQRGGDAGGPSDEADGERDGDESNVEETDQGA